MNIKTKLRLGFGFLFVVVIFFGSVSLFYLNQIARSAKVILKDNYESLRFTGEMRKVLDEAQFPLSGDASAVFKRNLFFEENNLTEPGEKEETAALRVQYELLNNTAVTPDAFRTALLNARVHLRKIDQLNMNAIVRKNAAAQESVKKATIYLSFAACFTFLVLFSFSVNFPGFVANPLRELLYGIREISQKNYRQRLEVRNDGEFSELAEAFNEMAKQLNEWDTSNLAKLKSEKLRIEAIIGQMQDAIIGLNEKQEILFINTAAQQVLNLDGVNSIGKNATELAKNNDLLRNIIANSLRDKQLKIFADGKESYFQLDSREIILQGFEKQEDQVITKTGKPAGKVYILRNITQFKELDTAKTHFIATVSHELKTPISSIKMSLKLLSDDRVGSMNSEQLELVQHIREDSDRLLKITSELLDLSRAEAGNLQLQFSATDPNVIVNYAVDAVKFQAEQKEVKLELVSRTTLPKVMADTEKTAWVLINFLSNALRYSPEKSRIVIQVIEKGAAIEFSVRDFGNGIDKQYQKRLFDRYFQVPTDGTNKSGSGLGLAISKDFIEAEHGRIWVESEIGEGSRFCFSLPVA
ncbi:HAMP domain-containing sensor histidine kinase [Hufsiella ginkgonis]|uniref:histidine kinase n=1 Tax=Hufsiella ginkgonis TaxID=2695274 RepID=A0A7K1XTD6_9SPHI|nr:ATP-binding protein [Hufsiella ginkgonis]MXV14039.1 HAMP domain-containing protein [Hufsiella ginkgonis]